MTEAGELWMQRTILLEYRDQLPIAGFDVKVCEFWIHAFFDEVEKRHTQSPCDVGDLFYELKRELLG